MQTKPVKIKFCKLCEQEFPWTPAYFHYWDKSSGRLHPYCKPCKINYVMAWKHGENFKKIERRKKIAKGPIAPKKVTRMEKPRPKKNPATKPIVSRPKRRIKLKNPIPTIANKNPTTLRISPETPRTKCRKAIALFLSDRISTADLFKAIEPFYGFRTKAVVEGLRLEMGL